MLGDEVCYRVEEARIQVSANAMVKLGCPPEYKLQCYCVPATRLAHKTQSTNLRYWSFKVLLRISRHKFDQTLSKPLWFLKRETVSTLLEYVGVIDFLCDLQNVLLHRGTKKLRSSYRHDGESELAALLEKILVDIAILQPGSVSFEDSTEAARLLYAFNPVVECYRFNCKWVIAFLFHEHLLVIIKSVYLPSAHD